MKSYCSICNRETNQNILSEEKLEHPDDEHIWWEENTFQIIQCAGCDEISYRTLYTNAQMAQYHESTQTLYPMRGANSITIKDFKNLPLKIKEIYRETIDAFNNNLLILCSGGLRALVEAICIEKEIKGIHKKDKEGKLYLCPTLECKIEALYKNDFLTKENAHSLQELRFLGNEALHKLEKPSIEELKLAIEILELTISNVFEIHHKSSTLKNEITKRKK